MEFNCRVDLWQYSGDKSSWYFVSLPHEISADIKQLSEHEHRRGFGSVKVEVKIGSSTWQTSVFPDSKKGVYILPVKKQAKQAEGLLVNTPLDLHIRLI